MLINSLPLLSFAISVLFQSGINTSSVRVRIVFTPSSLDIFFSSLFEISRTISFSLIFPFLDTVPGSFPPWPGSMTMQSTNQLFFMFFISLVLSSNEVRRIMLILSLLVCISGSFFSLLFNKNEIWHDSSNCLDRIFWIGDLMVDCRNLSESTLPFRTVTLIHPDLDTDDEISSASNSFDEFIDISIPFSFLLMVKSKMFFFSLRATINFSFVSIDR